MRKPVYARSLTSAFVVHCLDSIIHLLATVEISKLASLIRWADSFESYLGANPEDRFSHDEAQM